VTADIGADFGSGTDGCPSEEDAVLEEVDQAARFVGFVLGADVEAGDDVKEWQIAFFIEENAKAVVEDEEFSGIFHAPSRHDGSNQA
jgi:hypothetical protein